MILIDQLLMFYYKYDKFQSGFLAPHLAKAIYQTMLDKERIHSFVGQDGKLLGYAESFRINYTQLGNIVCGYNIYENLRHENITDGPIAYLANVTIDPAYRNLGIIKYLRNEFFIKNKDAEYFLGHAKRKKCSPWKVFNRSQLPELLVKEEIL